MQFKVNKINLTSKPFIETPIENEELLLTCQLTQFDREGYELLPIEQEYYKAAGITLHTEKVFAQESGSEEGWKAFIVKWFEDKPSSARSSAIKLDHSFCLVRYAFKGKAYEQIKKFAKKRPELNKLLSLRPKWGSDFCADLVYTQSDTHIFLELVHWEWDFLYHDEFVQHTTKMEDIVAHTHWDSIIDSVNTFKFRNTNADSEVEGNYKANLFGLPKANRLYKVLV